MSAERYWIEEGRGGWLQLRYGTGADDYSILTEASDVRRMDLAIRDVEDDAKARVARATSMRAALNRYRPSHPTPSLSDDKC